MCSHDWEKNILGNLKNDKLIDIWLSKKWNETEKCSVMRIDQLNLVCMRCIWNTDWKTF